MKPKIALTLLLLFSFFLYTFRLDQIPPSVYVDEATVGYNAFSILETGQDEYGQKLPIYFRFFGAYTPGLHVYFLLPFIKFFGLNPFSIRILSAISGVISVCIFYLLINVFTKNSKKSILLSAFYAIIPWQVFNSRLGYEVMFAATIFNAGLYFLIKNQPKLSLLGLVFISLSTYAAHTQRFLVPLFLFVYFIFITRPNLKSILVLFLTQIPNLLMLFTPAFWIKSSGFSPHFFLGQIIGFLSPLNLFFLPNDIDQQHLVPQISLFYWWMILPFIFGLKHLITKPTPASKTIIILILTALVPACLSGEFISVQRFLPLLLPFSLIICLGLSKFNNLISGFLFLISILLLLRSYFLFFPKLMATAWNYGYQELSLYVSSHPNTRFVIDNTRNPRNYILLLFHLNYSPTLYHQETGKLANYYQNPLYTGNLKFANIEVRPLDFSTDPCIDQILVGDPLSVSPDQAIDHHLTPVFAIHTPQNELVLQALQTNPATACPGKVK
ncbi:MAG: hypothetical protein WCV93_04845 [Candidatus Shapirobacteria bacterium]